jgi:prepilin-type N-terminal cleavage/methylation domain-containing protein
LLKIATKNFFIQKKNKSFTLIELLVVIAIIGILASLIFTYLNPAQSKARDVRRQSDIRQIHLAMELCYDKGDCGAGAEKYYSTDDYCDPGPCPNHFDEINYAEGIYLDVPLDPLNYGDYRYTWVKGGDQYYCVYVKLENPSQTTWFCGSNKGVFQKEYEGPPTKDDCCGRDVDS